MCCSLRLNIDNRVSPMLVHVVPEGLSRENCFRTDSEFWKLLIRFDRFEFEFESANLNRCKPDVESHTVHPKQDVAGDEEFRRIGEVS